MSRYCLYHIRYADAFISIVKGIDASLRLLYMLLMSESSPKSLGAHLRERSDARDWFISGVGRMACADTPDWLEDEELLQNLDQLAGKRA